MYNVLVSAVRHVLRDVLKIGSRVAWATASHICSLLYWLLLQYWLGFTLGISLVYGLAALQLLHQHAPRVCLAHGLIV